jgi:predicted PurR-regulated permease PerM
VTTHFPEPAIPQRTAPPRPAAPPPDPAPATRSTSERRSGLTPLSLLIVLIVAYLILQVQFVLVLLLLALVFATVIQQPVDALERRHLPRPLAILLVYVALIGGLTVLFVALAPVIRDQAVAFREQAPQSLAALQAAWQASGNALLSGPAADLLGRGIEFIQNPAERDVTVPQGAAVQLLTGLGGGIIGGVIGIVTVLIVTFYYLMEKAWIRRVVLSDSPPETRIRVSRIWDDIEQKVGDWLRGQLTLVLVIGITATIGYGLMGISFWPLLGLWAGMTEIIPIIGPWLGGIPAVIIALTQSWEKALLVVGFVILLQMTENAILVPRVMRGAVGLTPLTVFIAILVGTEFAGIPGALLAIPIAAAIQVLVSHHAEARREARLADSSRLPRWRWMRGSVAPPGFAPGVTAPAGVAPPAAAEPVTGASGWSADVLSRVASEESGPAGIDRP